MNLDLFHDTLASRPSLVAKIDVRLRVFVAFAFILVAASSLNPVLPLCIAFACLVMLVAMRVPVRTLAARLLAPLTMVGMLLLIHGLMIPGKPIVHLGPLAATGEGLTRGAILAARVFAAVSVMLLLSMTSPLPQVLAALRWYKVPELFLEVLGLAYRFVFMLRDQAVDVASAQRTRLGRSTFRRTIRATSDLMGTVLLRAFEQAERTHEAMVLRGGTGSIPREHLPPLPHRDAWFMAATLAIAIGLGTWGRLP